MRQGVRSGLGAAAVAAVAAVAAAMALGLPAAAAPPPVIVRVAAGGHHTSALDTAGQVWCWGYNDWGQLGYPPILWDDQPRDPNIYRRPVRVRRLLAAEVAPGGFHTCALGPLGAAYCWGANGYGQLGNGRSADSIALGRVRRLGQGRHATQLDPGDLHSCALRSSGRVACWGYNLVGQLGDGTNTSRLTPVEVLGLTDATQVTTSLFRHTCALRADGRVLCWGENGDGQLGDGTTVDRWAPVEVLFPDD
ncbi:MAG: hypothetical protein KJZ85_01770 [Rhodobacteraceae bacterium]|nr:hypothetical protein [Paracoccaceae bacterium]